MSTDAELDRLRRELAAARAAEARLLTLAEEALVELEQGQSGIAERLTAALGEARHEMVALRRRGARLEQQRLAAEAAAAEARTQLATELEWVADQARRIEASQAWRLGHTLVRRIRRLTFRRDRGTDALSAIVLRLSDSAARPSPRS